MPADSSVSMAFTALSKLPGCLYLSCTSFGPSSDTDIDSMSASFMSFISSSRNRKPLVMIFTFMPCPVSLATICFQSGRMNTSPPIMDTRLQPSSFNWSATSRHSAVVSSFSRFFPPLDPQYLHEKQHASVISQTHILS